MTPSTNPARDEAVPAVTDEMLQAARDTLAGGFTDICDADLEDIWEAMHRASLASDATPAAASGSEDWLIEDRDSWRRVAERCETEKQAAEKTIARLDKAATEANALYLKMSAERGILKAALEGAKRRFKEISTGVAYQPSIHAGAGIIEIDEALAKPSSPAGGDVLSLLQSIRDRAGTKSTGWIMHTATQAIAALHAALSPSTSAAEPVAWIANDPEGGPYLTWSGAAAKTWPNPVALYAHPAPVAVESAQGVKERIAQLEAEVARVRSDREYVIGFNAGWDEAIEQNLRFPTMLRKMWSGQEVQQWIDNEMASIRASLATEKEG